MLKIVASILLLSGIGFSQSVPDAPSASKTQFWLLTSSAAAVTAYDGWQTARPGREVSTPWLYGTYPSEHKTRLAVTLGAEVAASALLSHWMQHSHNRTVRRLWVVPLVFTLANHSAGIAHNVRSGQ